MKSFRLVAGRSSLVACFVAVLACGEDEAPRAEQTELPDAPQLSPNPAQFFLQFPLTLAGEESVRTIALSSGGKQPLVIETLCFETAAQQEAVGYEPCADPQDGGVFSFDSVDGVEVESGDVLSIPVTFAPLARGVSVLRLTIVSNAENRPLAGYELIGPAAAFPLPTAPDIAWLEDEIVFHPTTDGQMLGYARFFNLGGAQLVLTSYALEGASFSFPEGLLMPSAECAEMECGAETQPQGCEPVTVGTGALRTFGVFYTGSGAASGTLQVMSNDPDQCELEATLTVE